MLEIALDETENGVFQKDIAARQKISVKYLDNIISSLKTSGLILTRHGRKSGYVLSRKPSEITVLDIYNAFEPGMKVVDCVSHNFNCELADTCGVKSFWTGLNSVIDNYFVEHTLEDLIKEHRKNAKIIKK